MDDFLSQELLPYCIRILSIYFHIVTETGPSGPPIMAKPIPQLVAQQTLAPVAQKIKAVAKMDVSKTMSAAGLKFVSFVEFFNWLD